MKRLLALSGAVLLLAAVAAPAVQAADPALPHTDRVVMAFSGDIEIREGEQADVVIVGDGDALIAGTVETLVVFEGRATLRGATVGNVAVFSGELALEDGATVLGDVRSIESSVTRADGTSIGGAIKGIDSELLALGAVLVPALFLFAIGMAVATIVAGLVLVAVGSRQVRAAERLIVREPGAVIVLGLLAVVVIPLLAILAIVTIVGAPIGLAVLLGVLPTLAFVGFLVAAIFLGEWMLGTAREPETVRRPYKAALVGLIVLQVVGLIPGIGGLVTAAASIVGLGAVLLLAWRTVRTPGGTGEMAAPHAAAAPMGA